MRRVAIRILRVMVTALVVPLVLLARLLNRRADEVEVAPIAPIGPDEDPRTDLVGPAAGWLVSRMTEGPVPAHRVDRLTVKILGYSASSVIGEPAELLLARLEDDLGARARFLGLALLALADAGGPEGARRQGVWLLGLSMQSRTRPPDPIVAGGVARTTVGE